MRAEWFIAGPPVPLERARVTGRGNFLPERSHVYRRRVQASWEANKPLEWSSGRPVEWDNTRRFRVSMWITFADKRRRDLDNAFKAVSDALNGRCWRDDEQIDEIHVYRMPPDKANPGIRVVVEPI